MSEFEKSIKSIQRRLLKEIIFFLGKLQEDDSAVITNKMNLELALRLEDIISLKMKSLGYDESLLKLSQESKEIISKLRAENVKSGLSDTLAEDAVLQIKALDKVILEKDVRFLPEKLSSSISQIVYGGVLGTLSHNEIIDRVEQEIQIRFDQAVTLVEQYQHALRNTITISQAKESGIEHYLYAGVDDSLTRPFCKRMVDKIWTLEELDSLGDSDLRGRQPLPVSVHLGGFNCRHYLEPLDEETAQVMLQAGEARRGKV
mgnify:CR=1 FL=1